MAQALEIDFGRTGGGLRRFDSIADLQAHISREQEAWANVPGMREASRTQQGPATQSLNELTSRWTRLSGQIPILAQQPNAIELVKSHVLSQISQTPTSVSCLSRRERFGSRDLGNGSRCGRRCGHFRNGKRTGTGSAVFDARAGRRHVRMARYSIGAY